MEMLELYNFFRSGTSHRLRIALKLKGLQYTYVAVNLRTNEHKGEAFTQLNPQQLVPALLRRDGASTTVMTQSPAIIEWLEERYPTPALLPAAADDRARVRAMAAVIGCDIHPINNKRVLDYLRQTLGCDEAAVQAWCHTWISAGFDALETMLAQQADHGPFCFGDTPTLADVYLIPQVESARRFNLDLAPWPRIRAIDATCASHPAFQAAAPLRQPDAAL